MPRMLSSSPCRTNVRLVTGESRVGDILAWVHSVGAGIGEYLDEAREQLPSDPHPRNKGLRHAQPSPQRAITVALIAEGIALANRANIEAESAESDYVDSLTAEELAIFSDSLHILRLHASPAEK